MKTLRNRVNCYFGHCPSSKLKKATFGKRDLLPSSHVKAKDSKNLLCFPLWEDLISITGPGIFQNMNQKYYLFQ
jgi:hypothetical protein